MTSEGLSRPHLVAAGGWAPSRSALAAVRTPGGSTAGFRQASSSARGGDGGCCKEDWARNTPSLLNYKLCSKQPDQRVSMCCAVPSAAGGASKSPCTSALRLPPPGRSRPCAHCLLTSETLIVSTRPWVTAKQGTHDAASAAPPSSRAVAAAATQRGRQQLDALPQRSFPHHAKLDNFSLPSVCRGQQAGQLKGAGAWVREGDDTDHAHMHA